MNPETDIICLEIVKGVPKAPKDTESAEQELVTLNLLDPDGFGIQVNGWSLAFPGIKRDGTWAESSVTDGRQLIAAPKENVTESMSVAMGNADLKQRYQLLAKLQRMADDAREFWTGGSQIEPVYLKFKANGARVYQYALIYNITIAKTSDPFDCATGWELNLTIEREFAWRMVVPPGGNPIEYHFFTQQKRRGIDYTFEDMILYDNDDHWAHDLLDNSCEFDGTDKTTFLTKTWIDIDAADIPGDAPALLCITFGVGQKQTNQLYMALSTEPRRRFHRTLDEYAYTRNTLNAGDGGLGTVRVIDGCGLRSNDQVINRYIHQETIVAATTAFADSMSWRFGSGAASPAAPFLFNQLVGDWAIYMRCQTVVGADGDIEARLVIQDTIGLVDEKILPATQVPFQVVVGGCIEFDLAYMGRITFPFNQHVNSSSIGAGYTTQDDWDIRVQVRNTSGGDRVFEILDLIFIPISEGFCIANPDAQATHPYVSSGSAGSVIAIDNTGYFFHGHTDDYCAFQPVTNEIPNALQLLGSPLTLKPGIDNRVYFLFRNYQGGNNQQYCAAVQTPAFGEFEARLNIVPRCYGIADL